MNIFFREVLQFQMGSLPPAVRTLILPPGLTVVLMFIKILQTGMLSFNFIKFVTKVFNKYTLYTANDDGKF